MAAIIARLSQVMRRAHLRVNVLLLRAKRRKVLVRWVRAKCKINPWQIAPSVALR